MPRPKKIIETTKITEENMDTPESPAPVEVMGLETPAPLAPPTQDEKDINRFMNSFGVDGGKVRVYKYDASGNAVFQGPCTVDVISEEYIQAQYGEGRYQVKLINAEGVYVTSRTLSVGPPPGGSRPAATSSHVVIETPQSSGQMDMLRSELAANREMMLELVRSISNRPAAGASEKSTFAEVAEAMAALKNVVAPPEKSPMSSFTDMLAILKQGIELGQSGGGALTEKPGWMSLAREAMSALPAVVGALRPAPVPVNGGNHMAPQANPLGIPPELYNKLLHGIAFLKNRAAKNSDVGLFIDLIVENVDVEEYSTLIPLAMQATLDQIAAATDPEIGMPPYRAWFENLFGGIKDAINEQNRINAGATGDGADAIDNGGSGPVEPDRLPNP